MAVSGVNSANGYLPSASGTESGADKAKAQQLMRASWDQWATKYGATGKMLLDGAAKACGAV